MAALRGTAWRGRDCRDDHADIYAGTWPADGDKFQDSNCNGIHGTNPDTGQSYERELCSGSRPMGTIVIGDSASAHFHAPPEWFTVRDLSKDILQNLTNVIENELDWPHLSYFTGFENISWPIIHGTTQSVYSRMRERNRCNHRDYQNLAVNGASSFDLYSIREALARNPRNDYPAFVAIALVGNDVCNHYPDTLAHMTTPEQMRYNLLDTLVWLDSHLPAGSHVLLGGLADGRVLYEALHNRVHPIGSLRGDVKYTDVYNWFNCLEVTPCMGWMNTNETMRDLTSKRAAELTEAIKQLALEYTNTFINFDVHFLPCPMQEAIDIWVKQGREIWELIEPADGFHPNQFGNKLFADVLWRHLESEFPHIIGQENPNNDVIAATFGDQGGY
ncbi:PREDICTED: acyloxyacyl hydrolase-like [Priapulus caudatus]|uniref:Acyloxyacyl hydrolase-like n=1 Tax=Priapulus caudatus TaxID=37621 RepID=A0ABM1E4D0_PRICU|nr:PREDICTED: acyloxyacyl hydrolase-like [Priapulus caudatus]